MFQMRIGVSQLTIEGINELGLNVEILLPNEASGRQPRVSRFPVVDVDSMLASKKFAQSRIALRPSVRQ